MSSVSYGRLTEHHYLVDQRGRRRIRRGALIFFVLVALLIFACAWGTILAPENFAELF